MEKILEMLRLLEEIAAKLLENLEERLEASRKAETGTPIHELSYTAFVHTNAGAIRDLILINNHTLILGEKGTRRGGVTLLEGSTGSLTLWAYSESYGGKSLASKNDALLIEAPIILGKVPPLNMLVATEDDLQNSVLIARKLYAEMMYAQSFLLDVEAEAGIAFLSAAVTHNVKLRLYPVDALRQRVAEYTERLAELARERKEHGTDPKLQLIHELVRTRINHCPEPLSSTAALAVVKAPFLILGELHIEVAGGGVVLDWTCRRGQRIKVYGEKLTCEPGKRPIGAQRLHTEIGRPVALLCLDTMNMPAEAELPLRITPAY